MNQAYFLIGLIYQATVSAQTSPALAEYQQRYAQAIQSFGDPPLPRTGRGVVNPSVRPEKGKPFSATATTQTTQTFPDGTHVTQTTSTMEYRDAEGRTRTEPRDGTANGPMRNIEIRDPVAGVMYGLNPSGRFAVKINLPGPAGGGRSGGGRGRSGGAPNPNAEVVGADPNRIVEDLGTKTVNGVAAQGTRISNVVPVGAIGNDREFRSVTERWFSPDLNLLVKSVSTDPRFGTTTYELTNISRQPPDPALFRPPADYNVVTPGPPQ